MNRGRSRRRSSSRSSSRSRSRNRSKSQVKISIKKPGYLESCGYGKDEVNVRDMTRKDRRLALRKAFRREASILMKEDKKIKAIEKRKERTKEAIRKGALMIFRRLNVLTIYRKNKKDKDSMEDKKVFNKDKKWIKDNFLIDDSPDTLKEVWSREPNCSLRNMLR